MSRKEKGDGDSATQKCGPNRHCPHSHFILWSDLECIFAVHRRVIAMDSQTDSGNWWGFSHSSRWWQSQDYPVQSSLTRIYKKRWMRIRLRKSCVLPMRRARNNSESQQHQDMSNQRRSINWRSGWKKNRFLTEAMTSSVRKASFSIGLGVCQGTSCQPDGPWRREDAETVPWLPCIWRWDRTSLFFSWKTAWYSQEKNHGQDPGNHIEGINQYEIADLWRQRSPHRWWWHIQETSSSSTFLSKRCVNEIIERLDWWSNISKILIIKGLDNQVHLQQNGDKLFKHIDPPWYQTQHCVNRVM